MTDFTVSWLWLTGLVLGPAWSIGVLSIVVLHRPRVEEWRTLNRRRVALSAVLAGMTAACALALTPVIRARTNGLPDSSGAIVSGGVIIDSADRTRTIANWMGDSENMDPLRRWAYERRVRPLVRARIGAATSTVAAVMAAIISHRRSRRRPRATTAGASASG